MAKFDSESDRRNAVLRRVALGELSPEEAETEFYDLGPLAIEPETIDLDPRQDSEWSLLMTLVWIIERDETAVRAVWTKARLEANHWVSSPLPGATGGDKKAWELV
jgi:hypothetical protein